ncbi:tRNA (guanosine(46)-N7)-methyltransferase TrmB [soil metagenome]
MAKRKLQRFQELETMSRIFQYPFPLLTPDLDFKGKWNSSVFEKIQPITLELGCGRGEYTVELSKAYPKRNFVGIDIKGARIWRGVKTINEENILNAAFLRTHIDWLSTFFDPGEIDEIWITFPDPQPQLSRENRRISNPKFLQLYRNVLKKDGLLHLKTDNLGFFDYTVEMLENESGTMEVCTRNLYGDRPAGFDLSIQTTYEKIFLKEGKNINYLRFRFS